MNTKILIFVEGKGGYGKQRNNSCVVSLILRLSLHLMRKKNRKEKDMS